MENSKSVFLLSDLAIFRKRFTNIDHCVNNENAALWKLSPHCLAPSKMCHLYVCGLGTRHARFKREWATTGKASYAPKNIARVHPSCLANRLLSIEKVYYFCQIGKFAILAIFCHILATFSLGIRQRLSNCVYENCVWYFCVKSVFCFQFCKCLPGVFTFLLIICYLSAYLLHLLLRSS